MVRKLAALVAVLVLALPGCGKAPPTTGSGAVKMKDPVWATYGWSKGRMSYIIYFVPNSGAAFNPDGLVAAIKSSKEGDVFEGALDGYPENSKSPFKAEPKKAEVVIEKKPYRGPVVFLVNLHPPVKVVPVQAVSLGPAPKDPEEWPLHAEAEVRRISKENPKIAEWPKEPPPPPDPKKKK